MQDVISFEKRLLSRLQWRVLIPTPCELRDLLLQNYYNDNEFMQLVKEKAQKIIWIFLLGRWREF